MVKVQAVDLRVRLPLYMILSKVCYTLCVALFVLSLNEVNISFVKKKKFLSILFVLKVVHVDYCQFHKHF